MPIIGPISAFRFENSRVVGIGMLCCVDLMEVIDRCVKLDVGVRLLEGVWYRRVVNIQ